MNSMKLWKRLKKLKKIIDILKNSNIITTMNKQEKKKFIKEYCKSLSNDLLAEVSKMPENWKGAELRELVADRAVENGGYLQGERKMSYKNDRLIHNI